MIGQRLRDGDHLHEQNPIEHTTGKGAPQNA